MSLDGSQLVTFMVVLFLVPSPALQEAVRMLGVTPNRMLSQEPV